MGLIAFFLMLTTAGFALILAVPRLARPLGRMFSVVPRAVGVVLATGLCVGLLLSTEPSAEFGWAVILAGMTIFAWIWVQVFAGLMAQADDVFPGRFDKLIWVGADGPAGTDRTGRLRDLSALLHAGRQGGSRRAFASVQLISS